MPTRCVHELFELQAALTPERVALTDSAGRLTYLQAERRANHLARRLRDLGAGPDTLVALYARRSTSMILGMLGALKAEAAYVPIDPCYPALRVEHIMRSADPLILLTDSHMPDLSGSAMSERGYAIVRLDDDPAEECPAPSVDRELRPDSLAYVMYTSGSTGAPKGVAMQHDALVNMLQWHRRARPASPGKRTLQFCAIGFDFSFHEIFSTICFGGELVLAPDDVRGNPVALLDFVCQQGIERMFLPVSVLRQMAEIAGPVPPRLSEVIATGERLRIDPATARFFQRTGAVLHNHYGATEFQDALTFTLAGDAAAWPELPPAGYAIDNVRVLILDEQDQQRGPGELGELYIAGAGLGRGYYRQPGLTDERYGVHTVHAADGSGAEHVRLFRTGDLARLRPDGAVEILGRADEQVKINGVRVEPEEVEVVLAAHPAIKAVAVVAREDMPGQKRLIAYFTSDAATDKGLPWSLREFLAQRLPAQLVPSEFLQLDTFPLTSSGKLDRRALARRDDGARAERRAEPRSPRELEEQLIRSWCEVLQREHVGLHDNFFEAGGSSVLAARLHAELSSRFGAAITSTTLFQHPTIHRLTTYLSAVRASEPAPGTATSPLSSLGSDTDIAVIGMACRFPGADSYEAFWRNLCDGVESLTRFTDEELEQQDAALRDHPDYVKVGFVLPDIAGFDEEFFGYSSRDAAVLDPQQRLLLECAWEAFENAGYAPGAELGSVGVFAGSSMSTYLMNHIASELGLGAANPFIEADLQQFQLKMGNDRNYLTTRISYKLDLTGPSVSVQTACSTALVAVHLARRSILSGECEMALAGGISLIVPQKGGYLYEEGMVRSPDGHCRAFDAEAQGTQLGNGGGVVLLKRLSHAVRDRDNIIAVICGSAALNDGGLKAGYAAPSVDGQAATIAAAIREAGIDSARVGYVEAHGTATALGDPVEVAGLTKAFQETTREPSAPRCALGSVKTNIGHLDEAAGIAGLIKTALVVQRGVIPPSLNFNAPNPKIDFSAGRFHVNTALSGWSSPDGPRYAGVSAMGVGGTNGHVVLRQPPATESAATGAATGQRTRILALSARTPIALRALAARYARHLSDTPDISLNDVCYTANVGRKHFAHRLSVRARSIAELGERLEHFSGSGEGDQPMGETPTAGSYVGAAKCAEAPPRIAFVFPGLGTAYVDMGRELYEAHPVFRQQIDRCEQILAETGLLEQRLTEVLFPPSGGDSVLGEIEYAQPILFAFEYSLAQLLGSWGVRPHVVVGHSAGEYAAACVAGVFSLEEGIRLTALRGRMMRQFPNDGAMLEVPASEPEVRAWIARYDELYLGVINAPDSVVISGRRSQVDEVERELVERGVRVRRLDVPGAGHTPFQDSMAAALEAAIQGIHFSPPGSGPVLLSNLTGGRADEPGEGSLRVTDPRYWAEHSRRAVQFAANMQALDREGVGIVIEVGPRAVLTGLGRRCLPNHAGLWLPILQPPRPTAITRAALDEGSQMMACLSRLYVHGAAIDWAKVQAEDGARRIPLPTYPWQRRRHWFESSRPRYASPGVDSRADSRYLLLGQEVELAGTEEVRFQLRVSSNWPRWVQDHRAFGALVLPGVAYIDMALAAGAELLSSETVVVSDLLIQLPVVLADNGDETAIQHVLRPDGAGGYNLQIYSAPCVGGRRPDEWTLHVTGRLGERAIDGRGQKRGLRDMASLLAAHPVPVSLQQLKKHALDVAVSLGETFWIFEEIRLDLSRGSVFGSVRLTNRSGETARELTQYKVHPAYLEACLLALTATYPEELRGRGYAPFFVECIEHAADVECYAGPETRLWYHVRLRGAGENDDMAAFSICDCTILTSDGVPVVEISGFQLVSADAQTMLRTASVPYHEWLYETRWTALDLGTDERPVAQDPPGSWVVVGGDELAEQLAGQLCARGEVCAFVRPDDQFEQNGFLRNLTAAGDILFVQGDGLATSECDRLRRLAQALLRGRAAATPRMLWLITRNAYADVLADATRPPSERMATPLGACLAAMGNVITVEHPEIRCAQIDLEPGEPSVDLGAKVLTRIFRTKSAPTRPSAERTALRGDQWFGARLTRFTERAVLSPDRRVSRATFVSPDRSYLITGGLGGLGLLVAGWLAERGARHIILVGRSAPKPEAEETIRALEGSLTRLTIVQADVSRGQEVAGLFERLREVAPPLAGVIHAAGVANDAWFRDLTAEGLQSVSAPKVEGAWNLHLHTATMDLDWFVLFSSASALLGNPGQSGYAGANAFMDALASHRRSAGLPALSINWGTWSGAGLAASLDLDAWSRRSAEGYLTPPQGLRVLERLLLASASGARLPGAVAVMPIRWPEFLAKRPHVSPFFDELRDRTVAPATDRRVPVEVEIRAAPAAERRARLITYVQQRLAQMLGLAASNQVATDARLAELGLDSLMIVELRNHLQTSLRCGLPFAFLFRFPTIETLADQLLAQMFPSGVDTAEPDGARATSTVVGVQPLGGAAPFFFVSGVLGSILDQQPLARALGEDQPLFGLRSLGLDEDVEPYQDIREIAAHHLRSLKAVQPSGPYRLGGHSFGGVVAFEIARQLVQGNESVALLALVDSAAPPGGAGDGPGPKDAAQITREFLVVTAGATGRELSLSAEMLAGADQEQRTARVFEALREGRFVSSLADARRLLAVHRANHVALASYRVQDRIPVRTVVFRADTLLGHDEITISGIDDADETAGWSRVITGPIALEGVPGDHFTVMRHPGVGVIAEELAKHLSSVLVADESELLGGE